MSTATDVREWQPITLYENGEIVTWKGIEYRVRCTEHGDTCPGGGLRSGFLAPPECIEDGWHAYEVVADG